MGAWVYILRCADGSYYTGSSRVREIDTRLSEHELASFAVAYTASRRPVTLVYVERFERIVDAIAAERRIKGWSRAKKEALIEGDWPTLQARSKRRGGMP
ncbi:MAG: GIY-YIG nuclease family protein [Rhizobiales bacterium]|nr:GIY-YIG nuclease family protein [Hyphomicrobiales bacterium]